MLMFHDDDDDGGCNQTLADVALEETRDRSVIAHKKRSTREL